MIVGRIKKEENRYYDYSLSKSFFMLFLLLLSYYIFELDITLEPGDIGVYVILLIGFVFFINSLLSIVIPLKIAITNRLITKGLLRLKADEVSHLEIEEKDKFIFVEKVLVAVSKSGHKHNLVVLDGRKDDLVILDFEKLGIKLKKEEEEDKDNIVLKLRYKTVLIPRLSLAAALFTLMSSLFYTFGILFSAIAIMLCLLQWKKSNTSLNKIVLIFSLIVIAFQLYTIFSS